MIFLKSTLFVVSLFSFTILYAQQVVETILWEETFESTGSSYYDNHETLINLDYYPHGYHESANNAFVLYNDDPLVSDTMLPIVVKRDIVTSITYDSIVVEPIPRLSLPRDVYSSTFYSQSVAEFSYNYTEEEEYYHHNGKQIDYFNLTGYLGVERAPSLIGIVPKKVCENCSSISIDDTVALRAKLRAHVYTSVQQLYIAYTDGSFEYLQVYGGEESFSDYSLKEDKTYRVDSLFCETVKTFLDGEGILVFELPDDCGRLDFYNSPDHSFLFQLYSLTTNDLSMKVGVQYVKIAGYTSETITATNETSNQKDREIEAIYDAMGNETSVDRLLKNNMYIVLYKDGSRSKILITE